MKTFLTTTLAICLFALTCSAQWTGTAPNAYLNSTAGYTNVGIGTASPGTLLHIKESTARTVFTGTGLGTVYLVNGAGSPNYATIDFSGGSTNTNAESRIASLQTSSGSYLQFGTSNNYVNGITNTALTIDPSGRVGIGTATPNRQFVVTGTSNAADVGILSITSGTGASSDETLQFGVHDGDYSWLQAVKIGTGYRDLVLGPNGGNVGVGTTAPGTALDVSASSYTVGIRSLNTGALNAGSGGGLLAATPNRPTAAGQRLGVVGFGATFDGSTYRYTSVISGFSSVAWDGASNTNGSYLTFNTTPGTAGGTLVERMRIDDAGDIGIGTNAPNAQLDVKATTEQLRLTGSATGYASFTATAGGNLSIVPSGGKLGIGTTSPDQALTVNGQVHSTSVVVTSTVPAPDYVFNNDYALRPLADVKTYVDKNHHLPEVPSAADFKKDGQNLGEMNMTLLKKVEELTLYMIELNKKTSELSATVKAQQAEIARLKEGKK